MENKCVIDVLDFGNDERESRPSPCLNDRFEIRNHQEESESEAFFGVTAGCRRMWGCIDEK